MFVSTVLPIVLAIVPSVLSVPIGPPSRPSGFPSGLPSGFPTGRPTGFPTGFPTSLPSGFPTNIPGKPGRPGKPSSSASATSVTTSATAVPTPAAQCDVSTATVDVPAGQTALPASSGPVSFVALGVGVQNYTCGSAGTYTSAGAVASIFDLSCSFGTAAFDSAQDDAIQIWQSSSGTPEDVVAAIPALASSEKLGSHFFVLNPTTGTGISPEWDFRAGAFTGNADAFVIAAKQGNVAAPTGSQDIDWLFLTAVSGQGKLADQVYRTDTRLGQPPASCTPGSDPISVKYTSKYWLIGGSVKQ